MPASERLIALPHGCTTLIDEIDWFWVQKLTLFVNNHGYVVFSQYQPEDGRIWTRTLHSQVIGNPPPGIFIDHRNGDQTDNRYSNLRWVTPSQNQVNRHVLGPSSTGVRGVIYRSNKVSKWGAHITCQGTRRWLGSFATKEEAVQARQQAELEYYGELCPEV